MPTDQPLRPEPLPVPELKPSPKPKDTKPSRRHRGLWAAGGTAAVIVVAALLFVWPGHLRPKSAPQSAAAPTAATPTPAPPAVLYAFKDTGKTVVRQLSGDSSKDLFTYNENRNIEDGRAFPSDELSPAIAFNEATSRLAYASTDGLTVRGLTGQPEVVIKTKVTHDSPYVASALSMVLEPAFPDLSVGTATLGIPVWSRDGKYIGILAGLWEGAKAYAYDPVNKRYVTGADATHYIDASSLGSFYTLVPGNKPLLDAGLFPDFQVKEFSAAQYAQYSTDKKTVYALKCPKDLPATGDSKYTGDTPPNIGGGVDCGESQPSSLVIINLKTGAYRTKDFGSATDRPKALVVADNQAYLPLGKTSGYKIARYDLAADTTSELDVVKAAGIGASAEVTEVRLYGTDHPLAAVVRAGDHKSVITVVNLADLKRLGQFELSPNQTFSVLGLKP